MAAVTHRVHFHAGRYQRGFRPQQGHCLTLHVCAHQGAVGIVMLQERNERSGYRKDLFGRNVHKIDFKRRFVEILLAEARLDAIVDETAAGVQPCRGLGNDVFILFISRKVRHIVRYEGFHQDTRFRQFGDGFETPIIDYSTGQKDDPAGFVANRFTESQADQARIVIMKFLDNTAVGGFNEAITVDPAVSRQRADKADVGAFRSLDGADAAIMGVVHIAHIEAGALA